MTRPLKDLLAHSLQSDDGNKGRCKQGRKKRQWPWGLLGSSGRTLAPMTRMRIEPQIQSQIPDSTFPPELPPLSTQVAWVKSDSKTMQAVHDAVITHNRRVSISGDLSTTFNLHIAQIEEKDRGEYMCQINTDPMTYQAGYIRHGLLL